MPAGMQEIRLVPALVASGVFLATYVGILSGKIHRATVSIVGAAAMVAAGTWLHFYSDAAAFRSVDFNTIALLFGMMIVVGVLQRTGLFAYLAVRAAQLTRGNPVLLACALGLLTALLSTMLDNVTTIIVVAPVTLSVAGLLGLSPIPLLLGEVLLSNIGGVATLIGDPPNILIGSAAGFTFNDMLIHLAPVALVAALVAQSLLVFVFRRDLRAGRPAGDAVAALDAKAALVSPKQARQVLVILGATILLYLLHGDLGIGPGLVALIGASAALLWVRPSIEEVVKSVEWDVLVFFVGLFVIVGGLAAAGVLDLVATAIGALTAHGMLVAAIVFLWASAALSSVVGSIPLTMVMIPIVLSLRSGGLDVGPLWWALAIGAGFGGNGTPIGSAAGVLILSIGERTGFPISFRQWLRGGLPTTVASCLVGSLVVILAVHFGWF